MKETPVPPGLFHERKKRVTGRRQMAGDKSRYTYDGVANTLRR